KKMENDFAFIICPKTIKELRIIWPPAKFLPAFFIDLRFKTAPIFKIASNLKILFSQGRKIQGDIFICPLWNESTLPIEKSWLEENLRVGILGCDDSLPILPRIKTAVSNGNTFTAWSIFEAIYRIAKTKKIDLKKSILAIIDAHTTIGRLLAKKISSSVSKIILQGNPNILEQLKQDILTLDSIEVAISLDIHNTLKDADIVINANKTPELIFKRIDEFKPQSILCYFSGLCNHVKKLSPHNNITIIEAGLIKLPQPVNLGINLKLSKDIIPASLAEVLLLALERKFISYSFGENINPDKMEEIANIATRYGFEVWLPEAQIL
ncbi:MAG: hypothetical protein NC928_02940, partial [Candidatus Omnitrophica bacterium]|nr:hypothetical protein [Candidatus Omnitrophota bacterium]